MPSFVATLQEREQTKSKFPFAPDFCLTQVNPPDYNYKTTDANYDDDHDDDDDDDKLDYNTTYYNYEEYNDDQFLEKQNRR